MPIKTKYIIKCSSKQAPVLTTDNRPYVMTAFNRFLKDAQKGDIYNMQAVVEPVEPMSNDERFLYLVYEVRRLIRKFFDGGRKKEDLQKSLDKEKELDQWILNTRTRLADSPQIEAWMKMLPPDSDKARNYAFFILVEKWRRAWAIYFANKNKTGKNRKMVEELKQECFDFEKEIDRYLNKTLKL